MPEETVPLESIATAPAEPKITEAKIFGQDPLTGRDTKLDQHLGRVGAFIGGGPEKAGNIAYIVIVVAFSLLILGACFSAYAQSEKISVTFDHLATASISLITGALGYLFGSSKASA